MYLFFYAASTPLSTQHNNLFQALHLLPRPALTLTSEMSISAPPEAIYLYPKYSFHGHSTTRKATRVCVSDLAHSLQEWYLPVIVLVNTTLGAIYIHMSQSNTRRLVLRSAGV
jgi:hypothetical protein